MERGPLAKRIFAEVEESLRTRHRDKGWIAPDLSGIKVILVTPVAATEYRAAPHTSFVHPTDILVGIDYIQKTLKDEEIVEFAQLRLSGFASNELMMMRCYYEATKEWRDKLGVPNKKVTR